MLTKDDFEYLLDKQAQLDKHIRDKKGISHNEWMSSEIEIKQIIALRVEVAEFVNECKDSWKYWTTKSPNLDRVLDEGIDVLHFILQLSNRRDIATTEFLNERAGILIGKDTHKTYELLIRMLETDEFDVILACLFAVLDRYGFTREDILDQYHKKNRENFRRLNNGY